MKSPRFPVEYVDPLRLHFADRGASRHSDAKKAAALRIVEELGGIVQPLIVQRSSWTVIDGDLRLHCAYQLGLLEVPVIFVEITPEQKNWRPSPRS